MRVLVFGGRDYLDEEYVYAFLDLCYGINSGMEIISGMARGADTLAANWAKSRNVPLHEFPAEWDKYQKKAGPIRNQQMIDEGHPDYGLRLPGGVGTSDMAHRLKKHGIGYLDLSHLPKSSLNPYSPRRPEAQPLTIESFT